MGCGAAKAVETKSEATTKPSTPPKSVSFDIQLEAAKAAPPARLEALQRPEDLKKDPDDIDAKLKRAEEKREEVIKAKVAKAAKTSEKMLGRINQAGGEREAQGNDGAIDNLPSTKTAVNDAQS